MNPITSIIKLLYTAVRKTVYHILALIQGKKETISYDLLDDDIKLTPTNLIKDWLGIDTSDNKYENSGNSEYALEYESGYDEAYQMSSEGVCDDCDTDMGQADMQQWSAHYDKSHRSKKRESNRSTLGEVLSEDRNDDWLARQLREEEKILRKTLQD